MLFCETTEQNMHLSSAFSYFVSLLTNLFVGNKPLPSGKTLCWQFHRSVNNPSELQLLAKPSTKVSSPFVYSVNSLKLKFFSFI